MSNINLIANGEQINAKDFFGRTTETMDLSGTVTKLTYDQTSQVIRQNASKSNHGERQKLVKITDGNPGPRDGVTFLTTAVYGLQKVEAKNNNKDQEYHYITRKISGGFNSEK